MLASLLISASFMAGLAKAPWWFWLLGGVTLALLAATDPRRPRHDYAEVRGLNTLPLVIDDLWIAVRGCLVSAAAFAAGTWAAGTMLF